MPHIDIHTKKFSSLTALRANQHLPPLTDSGLKFRTFQDAILIIEGAELAYVQSRKEQSNTSASNKPNAFLMMLPLSFPLFLLLAVEVLDDRLNDEVVERAVLFLAQSNQSLDRLFFHLLLWNVDRDLVKNLFLCRVIHLLVQ